MLGERPKLLIVSAEAGKAVALRERVEPIFDVKATTPEGLSAAMETGRFDFLLLGTQRFIDICCWPTSMVACSGATTGSCATTRAPRPASPAPADRPCAP
jgi:hypothetical protein